MCSPVYEFNGLALFGGCFSLPIPMASIYKGSIFLLYIVSFLTFSLFPCLRSSIPIPPSSIHLHTHINTCSYTSHTRTRIGQSQNSMFKFMAVSLFKAYTHRPVPTKGSQAYLPTTDADQAYPSREEKAKAKAKRPPVACTSTRRPYSPRSLSATHPDLT